MNVHYTVYEEYALATTESRFRSSIRELAQHAETKLPNAGKYSGTLVNNEFCLERKMLGAIPFTQVLGRYEYSDGNLLVQTWTRLIPLVHWLLLIGFPLQLLFISMLVLEWQNHHYFVGCVAAADVMMYLLLIRLVREDATYFGKVLTTASEG